MATITTRAGKGSPLTNTEVDDNFTNLNTDKAELSGATFTGNVGIGASPSSNFAVSDSGGAGFEVIPQTANDRTTLLSYDRNTSTYQTLDLDGSDIHFNISGTEKIRIDSSGNVGIGTTSPAYELDVTGSAQLSGGDLILRSDSSDADTQYIRFENYTSDIRTAYIRADYTSQTAGGGTALAFGANDHATETDTDSMVIDIEGNVGIGTTSPACHLEVSGSGNGSVSEHVRITSTDTDSKLAFVNTTGNSAIVQSGQDMRFMNNTANTERMRIDSSGNVLVGKTSAGFGTVGIELAPAGNINATRTSNESINLNRLSTDGAIAKFYKDGSPVGSIGSRGGTALFIESGGTTGTAGLDMDVAIAPRKDGALSDGQIDLGTSAYRFEDIYATNGTIQTSDRNEKQDIAELSSAEQRVAVAAKGLLRKFRWRDAVEEKGDEARIHFGIIAQDLQNAFTAEGLDAGDYAMFINSTWTDEETGEERSRMGVRYSELLAFIISAI